MDCKEAVQQARPHEKDTTDGLGLIFDIQDYAVHDGPGIRTVVFLKGCPLKCRWCSNPEGQKPKPELMHNKILCKRCRTCVLACPGRAVSEDRGGYPIFERDKICAPCPEKICEKLCVSRAIKIVGEYWSVNSLYERVKTSSRFYRNSGGGITLSGGEPLVQPRFVREFLLQSERAGLSVGVETCGLFDWSSVRDFVEKLDFCFFDIKCLDAKTHRRATGCGNETILDNLKRLADRLDKSKIILTITVVPGINASEAVMSDAAELCNKLGISKLRLLPYHSFARTKYESLGRKYTMGGSLSVNQSDLEMFKMMMKNKKIDCWIEGNS